MKYCTKCGNPSPPDAMFCEQCGNKLHQEQIEASNQPTTPQLQEKVKTSNQPIEKRNHKKWLLVSGVTVAVALLIFFSIRILQGSSEGKKLPSKITVGYNIVQFNYDKLNRLIRIKSNDYHSVDREIIYKATSNYPDVIKYGRHSQRKFYYDDNHVLVFRDRDTVNILTINSNKLSVKKFFSCSPFDQLKIYYKNENIVKTSLDENCQFMAETKNYTPSDIKSIWRYVNAPDWFITHISSDPTSMDNFQLLPFLLNKKGNMPKQYKIGNTVHNFSYELDDDGYVKQIIQEVLQNGKRVGYGVIATIEYIRAK